VTDHDHRPLPLGWPLVAWAVMAALMVVIVAASAGCSRKPDTQFEPTKPLVVWIPHTGQSMLPTLPETGVAPIDIAYPFSRLVTGDIVLFWDYRREGFTLHRIVARQGRAFIVRGDNPITNREVDAPFLVRENFIGKYVKP
jgi:hypothetical protein